MSRKVEQSRKLQRRAEQMIPGGVNSPVRAFRAVGGDPPFIVRGAGSRLWDADGNKYIDYIGSWGPQILGHAAPAVTDAVIAAAKNGTSFGASTPAEADLAEIVLSAFPHMQRVRFVSSGTEATMSAIRLARAYTKRKYIVKFEGCYHGHADALLVKAGSGVATLGIPGSAGVPEEFTQFTLALPYNDTDALEQVFKKFRRQIACVIVEPVVGNMGCVPPARGYLEALRAITERDKTLLIFDEVMTGFRLAFGGAQELYAIHPDLTTMGKIIGGGLPVGAYGGPSEIMELVAPLGPMYQAGTLSGNPLAMAAGLATLRHLKEQRNEIYPRLDKLSAALTAGVAAAAKDAGVPICCNRVGSMFTWFFTPGPVTDWNSAAKSDTEAFGRFFRAMLENGVYLPPSQFEAAFLSAAHAEEDLQQTIAAAKQAFAAVVSGQPSAVS
ncbi:MAG TPA: glutamate-1-semialdehyde 2,1-aminomutase [Terriglobales bacterium]|jgi:glutamate-1-semialdehyde 2,1-aminomutase|nr:glutamate-1-semialdehyde 2,1-aminomutase [Terriglobales bacterium]